MRKIPIEAVQSAFVYDQFGPGALLVQELGVFAADVEIVEVIGGSHEDEDGAAGGLRVLCAPAVEHDVKRKLAAIRAQNSCAVTLEAGAHCRDRPAGKTDDADIFRVNSCILLQCF